MISSMMFSMIARKPRAPDFLFIASRAIARSASSVNLRWTLSISNSFEYCLVNAFFGSFKIRTRADLVQLIQRRNNRQSSDEFRNQAEFQQVFRLHVVEQIGCPPAILFFDLTAKAHALAPDALTNDVFEADESAAANKQNIRGVHLEKFLLGMLSSSFRRDTRHRAFDNFQQRLLHAFTGNIPGDRRVVRLPAKSCRFHLYRRFRVGLFQRRSPRPGED